MLGGERGLWKLQVAPIRPTLEEKKEVAKLSNPTVIQTSNMGDRNPNYQYVRERKAEENHIHTTQCRYSPNRKNLYCKRTVSV